MAVVVVDRILAAAVVLVVVAAMSPALANQESGQPDVGNTYLGCYLPTYNAREYDNKNTPQSCARKCAILGYPYTGVAGAWCWCDFKLSSQTAEKDCAANCPGNANLTCGGSNRASIYKLDPGEYCSCFHYGMGFDSPPLGKVEADSAEECQHVCKEKRGSGCMFFTYDKNARQCILYPSIAWAATGRMWAANLVSGPASCGCYEAGVTYNADYLRIITGVASVFECQKKCQETPTCHYFNYQPTNTNCYLRKGKAPTNRYAHQGTISGPRSCVGCFCTGKAYEGDLGALRSYDCIPSATQCQMHCIKHRECVHFNYFPAEKRCELRSDKTEEQVTNPGAISGPEFCDSCPCSDW